MSDLMELDLFAPQEAGFRLERFEVFNWGTFDGQVAIRWKKSFVV